MLHLLDQEKIEHLKMLALSHLLQNPNLKEINNDLVENIEYLPNFGRSFNGLKKTFEYNVD